MTGHHNDKSGCTHKKAAVRPDLRVAAGAYPPKNGIFLVLANQISHNLKGSNNREQLVRYEVFGVLLERAGRLSLGGLFPKTSPLPSFSGS